MSAPGGPLPVAPPAEAAAILDRLLESGAFAANDQQRAFIMGARAAFRAVAEQVEK